MKKFDFKLFIVLGLLMTSMAYAQTGSARNKEFEFDIL